MDEVKIIMETYESSLKKFRKLIQAQDLIREILCRSEGQSYDELKKLDKSFSKAINNFSIQHNIGSLTNKNFEE